MILCSFLESFVSVFLSCDMSANIEIMKCTDFTEGSLDLAFIDFHSSVTSISSITCWSKCRMVDIYMRIHIPT